MIEALRKKLRQDVVDTSKEREYSKANPTPDTTEPAPQYTQEQQQAPKQGAYSQLYSQIFQNQQPESVEAQQKREKLEKSRQTIANLSDGLAHAANVWFTSKGAVPAKLSSLSGANKKRYDYAQQVRDRNNDSWARGMFKAQTLDLQDERQSAIAKAQQEAAQRKYDYQAAKDKKDDERKDLEFKFKVDEAKRKADADANKQEWQKEYQQGMLGVAKSNAATSSRRADLQAQALEARTSGTGNAKSLQFAMSDGSVETVPDALKNDFYAEMYDYIASTASSQGLELPFLEYENDMSVSRASHMRDAVHTYVKRVEGGEDKLKELARRYNSNQAEQINLGTQGDIDDDVEDAQNDESDYLDQIIDQLIPNM